MSDCVKSLISKVVDHFHAVSCRTSVKAQDAVELHGRVYAVTGQGRKDFHGSHASAGIHVQVVHDLRKKGGRRLGGFLWDLPAAVNGSLKAGKVREPTFAEIEQRVAGVMRKARLILPC